MAYTDIDKPSDYFNTKLYTGTGTSGSPFSLTGVGFAANWVWIKRRGGAAIGHRIFDTIRGATKYIDSSADSAETTNTSTLTAFGSDGFTLQNDGSVNDGSEPFVSWNWKAGTSFTNDASGTGIGSIDSAGSFNNDSGFSIVSYTATGSTGTIKHGLNTTPSMILFKNLNRSSSNAQSWGVYHEALGNTKFLQLDTNGAENQTSPTSLFFNDTSPTSSVFSVGTNNRLNADSGDTYIAYCFAEKQGYSKFGSYTGNGNADGTFVYTGFKPAWLMLKKSSASGNSWQIFDNKRDTGNALDNTLEANDSTAEATGTDRLDFLSNGFKIRTNGSAQNASGATFIYMAFAENPFVTSSGVPATAR